MSEWAMSALVPLGAYAVGCVNGAYYLVRLRARHDLRTLGSGNAGARNAGRVLGRSGFLTALLIDAGKGAAAVLGARVLGASVAVVALAMVAVVAGHVWPLQLRLRGGKGAATAIGVLVAYDPLLAAILAAAGLILLAITRRLMVGGFVALVAAPVVASLLGHDIAAVAGLAGVAFIVVLAHRVEVSASVATADATLHEAPGPTGTYVPR